MTLKTLRQQRGWSQEDLAAMAGISTRTLQRAEQGAHSSAETLKALAAVLEVEFSALREATPMTLPHSAKDDDTLRERIEDLRDFYTHLSIFVIVNIFLILLNIFLTGGYPWALWAIGGWGIGIAIQAITVFAPFGWFGAEWEARQKARLKR